MLSQILTAVAIVAVIVGTVFSVAGVLGMARFPDVYTRLHAAGKVGVFGAVLLTVAAIVATPLGWSRGVVLMACLLVIGPVTSHAISSAAYRLGVPLQAPARDDLAATEETSTADPS